MDKQFDPAKYEAKIYNQWEKSGAFRPSDDPKATPYSIIMPPPNANGSLHTGHAMFTVTDILARYHRMLGDAVLWLPGTDHAGIETQVVYERELSKEGKSRFDLGPEKFSRAAHDYTLKNQHIIIDQMRSLGFSADWSRNKFTLDTDIVSEVYKTFKQLNEAGLIYRGNRIVNWCTRCLSAFADVEIKHVDRDDEIYTLDYGTVNIATTRPETIFADSAVAVNPKDSRYAKLIGQTATVPLVNRPISIIADSHVDPEFGTGALKVTPGHDVNDYEIGLRRNLSEISVIDLNGTMINVPEELAGLSVDEARLKTVELLKSADKLVATSPIAHAVGIHDRCGTIIEPLITEQWFLKVESLVKPAIEAVKNGQTHITPKRFEKVYLDWLENLHDWNISRQNWFGIRIPVFHKTSNDPDKKPYIVATDEAEAKKYYGEDNYRAETDIFDTWFSSSQWPFVTLMTNQPSDFERFYPTNVMGTARDILTKWVVTMMMMGLYRTSQVPFRDVYLWGMVNDAHGKKMSKSKGNVINPLDYTAKYGTDSLRMALTAGVTPGNDGSLGENKVLAYRNFTTKLWNIARFVLENQESRIKNQEATAEPPSANPTPHSSADHWMLNRLNTTITQTTRSLAAYRFSKALQGLYAFVWDDYADWYIEAAKTAPNSALMTYSLEVILKLLHPFAPFVTEAIWQDIPHRKQDLTTSPWPKITFKADRAQTEQFTNIRTITGVIRNLKSELTLSSAIIKIYDPAKTFDPDNQSLIAGLARVKFSDSPVKGIKLPGYELQIEVSPRVLAAYHQKLTKLIAEKSDYADRLHQKLSSDNFTTNAPQEVVQAERHRLAETEATLSTLQAQQKAVSND